MNEINLKSLLDLVKISLPSEFVNPYIKQITFNSKDVKKGGLFLGLPGSRVDGGKFWKDAINNGAAAAIISKEAEKLTGKVDKKKVLVLNKPLEDLYGQIISHFCGTPSRDLKIIGVTGTNGKTTVTFLIEFLLMKLGIKVALFGTLYNRWPGYSESSKLTTDFPDKLQPKLQAAKNADAKFAIMEISSHSIAQKRISGCEFFASVFTNLSQDHLDYHKSMESYFDTKKELFKSKYLRSDIGFSVINVDDPWGKKLLDEAESKTISISINNTFNDLEDKKNIFYLTDKKFTSKGSFCYLHTHKEAVEFFTPLVGDFNLMNSIQAIATLYQLGFPIKDICDAIKDFPGVPGRMEKIFVEEDKNKILPEIIVDYAHTPDGLFKVLNALKNSNQGRIITVFGCGGDRDSKKRPLMGSIAESFSDHVFITSDNPRKENPEEIIKDISSGIENKKKITFCTDRSLAIKKAINFAIGGDIVLIAGKGHEDYQILKNKVIKFEDKKIAKQFLKRKLKQNT